MGYPTAPLFDDDFGKKTLVNFAKFSEVKDLVHDYLLDYPRNKILRSYFKSLVNDSDIAGIYCKSLNPEDSEILDGLFGYIDIPSGMNGLVCDLVKLGSITYLFIYDDTKIGQHSIRNVNILNCGKF